MMNIFTNPQIIHLEIMAQIIASVSRKSEADGVVWGILTDVKQWPLATVQDHQEGSSWE